MPSLSILTSLYKSEKHINEFYQRSILTAQKDFDDIEFIIVNDASPDNSLNIFRSLQKKDNRITIIDLAINSGHHKALITGLQYVTKEYIWLIDIDLEEEPEWLSLFYKEFQKNNVDVIYGAQKSRKGNLFEKISGKLFFSSMKYLSDIKFQNNATTARLMSRRYANSLSKFNESSPILAGLWPLAGFIQKPIFVNKHNNSKTTYTFRRKLSLTIEALISYTTFPIKVIAFIGISALSSSIFVLISLAIKFFNNSVLLAGWTSTIASIWFFGGLITSSISLMAIYLAKIYIEVKRRPYTIIKKIYKEN